MEHVLDIYKLEYNSQYPVVCMDESPKQLIEDVSSISMKPGHETKNFMRNLNLKKQGDYESGLNLFILQSMDHG